MGLHTIATSYIPNPDNHALLWMQNFAQQVEVKHSAIGIDPAAAASLAALIRDFEVKLGIATFPGTATSPAISAKIEARNAATRAIQPLVKAIKAHPGIRDVDLIHLGLAPPRARRQAVPPPTSAPLLSVVAGLDGSHTLRYADERTPDSRRKPDGVMHMQLYVAIGKELVSDPGLCSFHGLITTSPFRVDHDFVNNGRMASYIGRWSTRSGLTGPWSNPTGMTISFVVRGGGPSQ